MTEHQHRSLDELADVLAEQSSGSPLAADLAADLASCPQCTRALDDLRLALAAVATDLARLPAVPALPPLLQAPALPASTTVVPRTDTPVGDGRPRRPRWLLPAGGLAAAAVLVVGGGLLLARNGTDESRRSTPAADADAFPISSSGQHYAKTTLPAAVPRLLAAKRRTLSASSTQGTTKAPADALARLRAPAGLASCLAGLSDPGDDGLPLALDYASWGTRPALVVVLPASRPSKVDVFVVGADCTQQESDLIYYLRADRP